MWNPAWDPGTEEGQQVETLKTLNKLWTLITVHQYWSHEMWCKYRTDVRC